MKTFYEHHGMHEGEFDELHGEGAGYPEGKAPPRCNRCGSYDVRWRQQGGRWVLFSLKPGVEHVCAIPDEFDSLD